MLEPKDLGFVDLLKTSLQFGPNIIWCIIVDEAPHERTINGMKEPGHNHIIASIPKLSSSDVICWTFNGAEDKT